MGRPVAGETVVVSCAAEATGSVVGQIAKIKGQIAERAEPVEEHLWKLHHEEVEAMKGVLTREQRDKLPGAIRSEMKRELTAVADTLDLTPGQRQKLESIREEFEPRFRQVCAESSEAAHRQMRQLRSEFINDARQVLNDEQKSKFFGVLREKTGSIVAGGVAHGLMDVLVQVPRILAGER